MPIMVQITYMEVESNSDCYIGVWSLYLVATRCDM